MMPPDRPPVEDPQEWLDHAHSNLVLARNRVAGVRLGDLCFNAQQAAEKAIKGLLVSRRIPIPFTHDLSHLFALAEEAGEHPPDSVFDAAELSRYAVGARYPEMTRMPVSDAEHEAAVNMAERVVEWVESVI